MNKQLSVMGLAARASMVPVLIASGLTALAVGVLTYLANPENTGGAAGVGAAPLAAAVGYLMVMVMLCLGGCGFGSQTLCPLPLRLTQPQVDRNQITGGYRFATGGHLLRRQRHAHGVLHHQLGRGHAAGDARLGEKAAAQSGAVPHHQLGPGVALQLLRQLGQGDGPVRGQPGELPAFGGEYGVIDLTAPGVHGTDDEPVHVPQVLGHGLQRGHTAAGLVRRPGQPLQGRYANAQPGEAARAVGHGQQVHVLRFQPGGRQHAIQQGHQSAAMGQAPVLIGTGQGNAALHHGSGHAFGGGFNG